jgi:hypothetical protein
MPRGEKVDDRSGFSIAAAGAEAAAAASALCRVAACTA